MLDEYAKRLIELFADDETLDFCKTMFIFDFEKVALKFI